jgi:hypothetical protein
VEQIALAAPDRPNLGSRGTSRPRLTDDPERLLLTIAMTAVLGTLVLLAAALIVWLVGQVTANSRREGSE